MSGPNFFTVIIIWQEIYADNTQNLQQLQQELLLVSSG